MKETNEVIRIAQIIGKWVGGGVEAVVMNYYRNIDKEKIQFDFICDEDSTNIPYEEIKKLGGRVILVPPYQNLFKYIKELKKVFKENKYKIVHSHINALSVFPLFAAKVSGIPVRIAHSHSTTNKKEWKKNIVKQVLRPFSKVFATDYFACSEWAGRWLFGNKTFEKGKVYILNNAIDIEKFKFDEKVRNEVRKKLNIADNTVVIGHIGRFVAQKNHTFLIDIFNEIQKQEENSKLLLIGQGPLKEEIENKVNNLGLSGKVIFLGQREDVSELYNAMDIFCLPSLYEGLGMVMIEAQISGCVCLVSYEVPKEADITESVRFLPISESPDKWSKEILKIINKSRKVFPSIEKIKKYDISLQSEKLIEQYFRCLKGGE